METFKEKLTEGSNWLMYASVKSNELQSEITDRSIEQLEGLLFI